MQERADLDISAGLVVALRDFSLPGGTADYLLYLDGKAAGVIEAKPEGFTLTGVDSQSIKPEKPRIRQVRRKPKPAPADTPGEIE